MQWFLIVFRFDGALLSFSLSFPLSLREKESSCSAVCSPKRVCYSRKRQILLHAVDESDVCCAFSDSTSVESLTCYRAFVSLTATAPDSAKLFRRRTKQRERKINLVTGPTQCKPYTSIHQKPPAYPPLAYPLIWTASQPVDASQKNGREFFRFLRVSEFD